MELYDRMTRATGWQPGALAPTNLKLLIAARGPVAAHLSLAAACIGIESQALVVPDVSDGLDAADAAMAHNPMAFVDVEAMGSGVCFVGAPEVVSLVDVGDPAFDDWDVPGTALVFAQGRSALRFGIDREAVAARRVGRPVAPSAEATLLVAELLASVCGLVSAYQHGATGHHFPLPPMCAELPLRRRRWGRSATRPCRMYVAGFGGAVAHNFLFAALGFDPTLREVFAHPDSVIVGADRDHVEESNRSRQFGYKAAGGRKAPETGRWLAELLPGARVVALDEPIAAAHFERYGPFDAAISSLDGWGSRRQLAELARMYRVPVLGMGGADFLSGYARLVTGRAACLWCGKEALAEREDRPAAASSCTAAATPAPSSLIPQAFIGGLLAVGLRRHLERQRPQPRGFEVHLVRRAEVAGHEGLCFSPGLLRNETCPCPGPMGGPR